MAKKDTLPDTDKRDLVLDANLDWNKWHKIIEESLLAFNTDDVADMCAILGIVDVDVEETPVKGGALSINLSRTMETLAKLHIMDWCGKTLTQFTVFEGCEAYRDEWMETAVYKLRNTNPSLPTLFEPCIEIRLEDNGKSDPWFNINFVPVGQRF